MYQTERTSVSDVEQHGHKDVVHQVQSDAVGEQGVPHDQQVLKRELAAKQQADPAAAGRTDHTDRRTRRKVRAVSSRITRGE